MNTAHKMTYSAEVCKEEQTSSFRQPHTSLTANEEWANAVNESFEKQCAVILQALRGKTLAHKRALVTAFPIKGRFHSKVLIYKSCL